MNDVLFKLIHFKICWGVNSGLDFLQHKYLHYSRQSTLWIHYHCPSLPDLHCYELLLFCAKAFPLLYQSIWAEVYPPPINGEKNQLTLNLQLWQVFLFLMLISHEPSNLHLKDRPVFVWWCTARRKNALQEKQQWPP